MHTLFLSLHSEIAEALIHLRAPLLRGRECIQDMVVRFRWNPRPLLGESYPKQHSCLHPWALLVVLQNRRLLPRLRPLSPHLLPTDSPSPGLCSGLPSRFRRRIRSQRTPPNQKAFADHKPSIQIIHTMGPHLHHRQSIRLPPHDHSLQRRRQHLPHRRTRRTSPHLVKYTWLICYTFKKNTRFSFDLMRRFAR